FPSLHHRKEGWPSDQKIIAKPPLIAASASVAARNLLDDAATPPCGDARRGITLDSNLFTDRRYSESRDIKGASPCLVSSRSLRGNRRPFRKNVRLRAPASFSVLL